MTAPEDIVAAFETAGLQSLTIVRRSESWGRKWFVHATFDGDKDRAKAIATDHVNLDTALTRLLAAAPQPTAKATLSAAALADLEDLL